MTIRTTECEHLFTSDLFSKLGAYSLQGLTMNANYQWTAAIEAIEFDDDESVQIESVFREDETHAKLILAEAIHVPLYYIVYHQHDFILFRVSRLSSGKLHYKKENTLDETGFINWWQQIKGTPQTKDLNNGAQDRAYKTVFDRVLESHGLAWGGNIDGFILRNNQPVCIIENIYTRRNPLNSVKGDPAFYFFKKGPNYSTWFPTVTLANELHLPMLLFTFDGNTNEEHIGLTAIHHLSDKGIFYLNDLHPYENVIEGMTNIVDEITSMLSVEPPYIK